MIMGQYFSSNAKIVQNWIKSKPKIFFMERIKKWIYIYIYIYKMRKNKSCNKKKLSHFDASTIILFGLKCVFF